MSVAALGLALVLLIGAAWATGLAYLLARLGVPSTVRLGAVDGVHVYVALLGAVFLLAKLWRVGLHARVPGVPEVLAWQRWLSWSLLALYAMVLLSGALCLLPVSGRVYADLVEIHLLSATWALLPTGWHVWHYRRRVLPYLGRWWGRRPAVRFWAGMALAALPVLALLAAPRAASRLTEAGGGAAWSSAGLAGVAVDRLAASPDGRTLLAGGDALYRSHDGATWNEMVLPAPHSDAAPGFQPSAGHQGTAGHADEAGRRVRVVLAAASGVYVGTADGLYHADTPDSRLRDTGFPGHSVDGLPLAYGYPGTEVRAVAAYGTHTWVAGPAGPMRSGDGARSWIRLAAGMGRPQDVAALGYLGDRLFASDTAGVYEWNESAHTWRRSTDQRRVVQLAVDPDGAALIAASTDGQVRLLLDGRWRQFAMPGTAHGGHLRHEPVELTATTDRLYAAGTSQGVTASADGGRTWTQLPGLSRRAGTGGVVAFHGDVWLGTADGVYRYALPAAVRRPSGRWWSGLLAAGGPGGVLTVVLVAVRRRRAVGGRR